MDSSIFNISSRQDFNDLAERIFRFQFRENPVYHEFVDLLGGADKNISEGNCPFLPIEMFKRHRITVSPDKYDIVFHSSGTGGEGKSKHFVKDLGIYEESFMRGFEVQYGSVSDYCILALLPAYLERKGSSLVYMADRMIKESRNSLSGFYLDELQNLAETLRFLNERGDKVLLLGVSFALLDLMDYGPFDMNNTIVMETGGMKGRRKEITRIELHRLLKKGFGVDSVHSEYGMTELLSQAYSRGDGRFICPPWMKVSIRELNDPFKEAEPGKTGGINVIDLSNIHSCSFIATQDLGRVFADGTFEVLGRFDQADLRGCSLMVQ